MKTGILLIAFAVMSGCGVETVGTAATAAALKKQEAEQAKATMAQVQRDLDAANRQMAQRAAQAEEATK